LDSIYQENKDAKKILILEDGSEGFNWGSEVACQIYESSFFNLEKPIKRLSAKDEIIPCADKLEKEILVTEEKIEKFIMELLV
jgi:pyruvate/2-oxoglutarate/acetoin dehydrogenase E1 component